MAAPRGPAARSRLYRFMGMWTIALVVFPTMLYVFHFLIALPLMLPAVLLRLPPDSAVGRFLRESDKVIYVAAALASLRVCVKMWPKGGH